MKSLSMISFAFLFASTVAFAAPSSYWMKGPCGEDVKKYCMESAAGEVMQCLRAHEKDSKAPLSASCKQKFAEKRGDADDQSAATEKKK